MQPSERLQIAGCLKMPLGQGVGELQYVPGSRNIHWPSGREGVQETQKQLTRRYSKPDAVVVYRHRQKKGKYGHLT